MKINFLENIKSLFGIKSNPIHGNSTTHIPMLGCSNASSSGVYVTESSSLGLPTVWACVQVLAQTISALPLSLIKVTKDGKFVDLTSNLTRLVARRPNSEMTALQWRSLIMFNLGLNGNHYSEIERNNAGDPIALWPIEPWRVTPTRVDGKLIYEVQVDNGKSIFLFPEEILHFKGLAGDGIVGISPIKAHCEAVGIGLAAQVSSGKFYSNDSVPSGILTTEQKIDEETRANIRKAWEKGHKGLENHHKVAIIDAGMKFNSISVSPADAKLIEQKKLTREDIAQIYRIPQHKVGIMERSTNNNIEQQAIEFGTDTIKPWTTNIEQELLIKLVPEKEWDTSYFRHDLADMMRGDSGAMSNFFHNARIDGWMNADEIRAIQDMNPLPEGRGKVYLVQANMTELEADMSKDSTQT